MAHQFDKKPDSSGDNKNNNNTESGQNDQNKNNSHESDEASFSFVQLLKGKCYCYGSAEHMAPVCRYRNKPKHQWAIHKAQDKDGQSPFGSGGNQSQDPINDTNNSTNDQNNDNGHNQETQGETS